MGYKDWGGYGAGGTGRTSGLSERDVMNVLELTLEEFNVDRDRVYLLGPANGGRGTFHLAIKYPDLWAALGTVVIRRLVVHPTNPDVVYSAALGQGGYPSPDALSAITHVPVIMVHGSDDSPESARTWVAKMAELGMTHRYVEIPGGDRCSSIRSDRDNVQAIFDFFDLARRN